MSPYDDKCTKCTPIDVEALGNYLKKNRSNFNLVAEQMRNHPQFAAMAALHAKSTAPGNTVNLFDVSSKILPASKQWKMAARPFQS